MSSIALAQELTLNLASDQPPFTLIGHERTYGPDEWAWLFLRLNTEYIKAYENVRSNPVAENIGKYLVTHSECALLRLDLDGTCRARFGLAVWLDPITPELPPLKENGSWFFPLKRLGQTTSLLPQSFAQNHLAQNQRHLHLSEDILPRVLASESPFGYIKVRGMQSVIPMRVHTMLQRSWIATVIDCTIPTAGQISALTQLAKVQRAYLVSRGKLTEDHHREISPSSLETWKKRQISILAETWDAGVLSNQTESESKWLAVAIDALGPIMLQLKRIRNIIETKKVASSISNVLLQPLPGRFPNTLPTSQIRGIPSTGGSYIKALLCVAELNRLVGTTRGYPDTRAIMAAITTELPSQDPQNAWRRDFQENLETRYIPQAHALIIGGYKWLIHAQKPKSVTNVKASTLPRSSPSPHPRRLTKSSWE